MKKFTVSMVLLLGLVPAMLFPASAAEQSRETRIAPPVVVTANRIAENARDVTASVTVIPREEIKKNQYQDVGGLLRNHGLQVDSFSPNGGLAQVAIRGVRSSAMGSDLQGSILLLVDGRRIGTDNIAMIPLVNVERIEIIRGPASVRYGAAAIGGVINVITRRGTEDLAASAEAGIGSWETYSGQGSLAWAGGPFDFSGGVSHMTAGDYYVGGNHRYANTGLNYRTAYNANLGYTFLEEHRLGLTVLGVHADDMGTPGYFNDIQHRDFTDRSNYSADLGYEGGFKDFGLSWKARYFAGKNDYVNDVHGDLSGMSYFNFYTNYQGSQGQVTFRKNFLTLTGGLDWLNYDTTMRGGAYPKHENSAYDNIGLFMLAKIALFDDTLIVNGGARHDAYTLKVDGGKKDLDRTTPSLGAAWHVTDWLTFKGNYGEAYRIPDAVALLGFRGKYAYLPNPDLKPEKARTYDGGFEVNHNSLRFGLMYFQTAYENKILTRFTPAWDTQYYNAEGKIRLKGVEGTVSYDIGEAFDWPVMLRPYVNVTQMTERKSHEGGRVPNVSDYELAYGVNFARPEAGFEADLRVTSMGRQYVRDFNMANPTSGRMVQTGGKTVTDLFIRQRIHEWKEAGTLSVNAAVRNIFDERYALVKDYPQPGRSFYLGIRYDY